MAHARHVPGTAAVPGRVKPLSSAGWARGALDDVENGLAALVSQMKERFAGHPATVPR
jgi:hypothetical protein